MLTTRSARLAAGILLLLLFGWSVRSWRKGGVTTSTPSPAVSEVPAEEDAPQISFPDE
ncbi:MAG: hypothetical protein R3F13_15580 [Prosthecobacter sp.]